MTRLVLSEGSRFAVIGIAAGLLTAAAAAPLLESQLFGVSPRDPRSYAAAAFALAMVTLAACWLPARRVAAISPLESLRAD